MDLPQPPPHGSDPIITQFKPVRNQWELTEDNIKRTDPETGRTILHNYCQHIKTTPLEVYRYLIETQGCDVNVQNKYNNTPIQRALFYFDPRTGGDITVLTYLLNQNSVNLNIKGRSGHTLLHYACEQINHLPLEIFKVLIETHGADVNVQNPYNDTPLHNAIRCFDPRNGGDISVLHYFLNKQDLYVNLKDKYGFTLLHKVCEKVNYFPLDTFKLLIETRGCDVNVKNNFGDTPLHNAIRNFNPNKGGDIKALAYLIDQKNVNLNVKVQKGLNLLHLACTNHLSESRDSAELNAEFDTISCQIVEVIVERCIEEVLDEINLK
jgi:ankyrin repeat protein